MESKKDLLNVIAANNDERGILNMLSAGLDPNFECGQLMRFAARCGSYYVVKALMEWGADPHLPGLLGATALHLAVFSGLHWEEGCWNFLLERCDSMQLADAAGVAIVFGQLPALNKILKTGRCDIDAPTSLTGRTVENLAKGHKLDLGLFTQNEHRKLFSPAQNSNEAVNMESSSFIQNRRLSPSVAHFFQQTTRFSPQHPAAIANKSPGFNLSPGHNPGVMSMNRLSPAHNNVMMTNSSPMHNAMITNVNYHRSPLLFQSPTSTLLQ